MSIPVPPPTDSALRNHSPLGYNATRYGHAVDWTSKCLLIDGVPRVIVSAEFQYFRVPDVARWRPLLAAIRDAGFNAIRIYVYWGYHSPAEGKFILSGNRDLRYLLELCTELQLFVIPAPGPYICAEVQGGGYPIWLIAKRNLRMRHLTNPPIGLIKRWDQNFHDYCASYFDTVVRLFVPHERTTNPNGCIIALQIENELRQQTLGIGGLDNELRLLAEIARNAGSTVPFFHNDDSAAGSWASTRPYRSAKKLFLGRSGPPAFATDLYGFDLYFTFPPGDKSGDKSSLQAGMIEICGVSATLNLCGIGGAGIGGSEEPCLSCLYNTDLREAPPPPLAWASKTQMTRAVDRLETKFAGMSGSAASGPPIIAEAQVGWINQWGRLRGYDQIYNFFGNDFSSTFQVSLMAQGVSVSNHYAAYGGTNTGSVGDTEVYSSYDYSAFIREYGKFSERGRRMRLVNYFVRTFATRGLAHTEVADSSKSTASSTSRDPSLSKASSRAFRNRSSNLLNARVKTTIKEALITVRQAVLPSDGLAVECLPQAVRKQPPMFAFLRNLFGTAGLYNLIVDNIVIPCFTPYCEAMVAPLFYPVLESLPSSGRPRLLGTILACTIPVIARANYAGSELWVLRMREAEKGRLILRLGGLEEEDHSPIDHPKGIIVEYAAIGRCDGGTVDPGEGSNVKGVLQATDQDLGVATSIVNRPLEEMPLSHWEEFSVNSPPVAIRASTETAGLCFSLAVAGRPDPCVISVRDMNSYRSQNNRPIPLLRLLCLTEADAKTLSVNCADDEPYCNENVVAKKITWPHTNAGNKFAAAWGAEELGFSPSGSLNIACASTMKHQVFLVCQNGTGMDDGKVAPAEFMPVPLFITNVLPGVFVYAVPQDKVSSILNGSMPARSLSKSTDPLSRSYEIPLDGWQRRILDWNKDCDWKTIKQGDFEPLDHMMTSGHIAYRVRFRTRSRQLSIVTNVRHVAALWCNGMCVGTQLCFSHNILSAGAMHGVDLAQAGKKRHILSHALGAISPEANDVHELLILVLNFGQSRCPFLLNDIRNRRGLLSARFSRRAKIQDVEWAIGGVDVSKLDNPYASGGLPLENEVNELSVSAGFAPVTSPQILANDGLVYFRTTFRVPACTVVGGNVRYPLRLRIRSSPCAIGMFWVNGLQIGRYVEVTGPQYNFYIPEGLIVDCKENLLVMAVYGSVDGIFEAKILPWIVERDSGNLNESNGDVFALCTGSLALPGKINETSAYSSAKVVPVAAEPVVFS